MGEEFQTGICGGNYWWNNMNSTRSVFPLMSPSPCSVAANDSGGMGYRTWKSDDMVELKATTRSGADQETNSNSNMAFLDDGTILMDSNSTLQIIGFGLSSNWNNHSLSGKPAESNFQEAGIDSSSNLPKSFSSSSSASTMDDLCGGFPSYGLTQSLYDPHPQPNSLFTNPSMGTATPNYGLHFSNWNASAEALNDMRAGVFPPSSQPQQYQTSTLLDHKPNFPTPLITKPKSEQAPDLASAVKKCVGEPAIKRQKLETPSPLPTFKVRKEKLGDRITALQQLVSPFGKTDTASVLHEAIEYIKFLHDQVSVLSTPYMKNNGAPIQQQQGTDLKELEGPKQDLRSRGLCLVPISSTFPVTNETTADFWTPSFGGALIR